MSAADALREQERCVGCGGGPLEEEERANGYRIVRCADCGLSQTADHDYARERYVAAYAHESPLPAQIYSAPERRLELEARALFVPPPRLTPSERAAREWVVAHAPPDAVVVDCGCGTGRFLRALRRRGIQAAGFELSEDVVELLRTAGLDASVGGAPDFAWAGEPPFAITFFEVLEHLPEPERFVEPLRRRFPQAHILASVPSPRRAALLRSGRGAADYPPNHFLRWTPEALERFFRRIGYSRVEVVVPPPNGAELVHGFATAAGVRRAVAQKRERGRVAATSTLLAARTYQAAAAIAGTPRALRWRRRGASSSSMLVIASP